MTKKFFHSRLKKLQYIPRVIVTGKLGSYAAAKYVQDKGANSRTENSHQTTRARAANAGIQNQSACSTDLNNL
ncbi:hypothetical protein ACO0KY_19110 [Undibacterium sp. Dicai25W]